MESNCSFLLFKNTSKPSEELETAINFTLSPFLHSLRARYCFSWMFPLLSGIGEPCGSNDGCPRSSSIRLKKIGESTCSICSARNISVSRCLRTIRIALCLPSTVSWIGLYFSYLTNFLRANFFIILVTVGIFISNRLESSLTLTSPLSLDRENRAFK